MLRLGKIVKLWLWLGYVKVGDWGICIPSLGQSPLTDEQAANHRLLFSAQWRAEFIFYQKSLREVVEEVFISQKTAYIHR